MTLRKWLILSLIFCCVSCTPQGGQQSETRLVQKGAAQISYQPAQLQTESPLSLAVRTPSGWQLHKATLVGLTMEMPRMPLFFTQNNDPAQPEANWQTQFLIGACADAQMTWRLELLFIDEKGAEQRLSDEFVVYRR
ncbi:MAG: hypothetical protein U5L02_17075 [Rheinheimera sp.]|nr:hypothetical protein [Rheinheimera sp.]